MCDISTFSLTGIGKFWGAGLLGARRRLDCGANVLGAQNPVVLRRACTSQNYLQFANLILIVGAFQDQDDTF